MKHLYFFLNFSLSTCFYFIGIVECNSQSACNDLGPKVPKVAIVSAGASKKICGNNTTILEAQIPNWMSGTWWPEQPLNSAYQNRASAMTNYTYPYSVPAGTGEILQSHTFSMKINELSGINTPTFVEKTLTVFYPSNSNANLTFSDISGTSSYFRIQSSSPAFRYYWTTVDGPNANSNLIANNENAFAPRRNGTFSFKSAIPGCSTNYITASVNVSGVGEISPNAFLDRYEPTGIIHVNMLPLEAWNMSISNTAMKANILNSNGQIVAILDGLSINFALLPTGTYTVVFGLPPQSEYMQPPPVELTISPNSHHEITVNYEKKIKKGIASVILYDGCGNGNFDTHKMGRWSIDNITYYSQNQGYEIELPIGMHTLYFEDIYGWIKPQTTTITIEEGKRTVVLGEYQKAPPCGRTDFGCSTYSSFMQISEDASCNPSYKTNYDYHLFSREKVVCSSNCDVNRVWQLLLADATNMAPIQRDNLPNYSDQTLNKIAILGTKLFTPGDIETVGTVESCKVAKLPQLGSWMLGLGKFGNDLSLPCSNIVNKINPGNNPIVFYVDASTKCVTNYTLPGHIFYPGKITRCIVEECGQVKVRTYGQGGNILGNNLCGKLMSKSNYTLGCEILFNNVDERFAEYVRLNGAIVSNPPPLHQTSLGIENIDWRVKEIKIKYSDNSENIPFRRNQIPLWTVENIKINFRNNGTYTGTDLHGNQQTGYWSGITDSIDIDSSRSKFTKVNSGEFKTEGKIPVYIDNTKIDATFIMTFETTTVIPIELKNFTAFAQKRSNELNWKVVNDINNKGYEIERKNSQDIFEKIGFVESKIQTVNYKFLDDTPLSISYYRLRQIDLDGKETFSKIVSVNREEDSEVSLYPNPTNGKVYLKNAKFQPNRVKVYNSLGQILIEKAQLNNEIDIEGLPSGIYYIELWSENKKIQKRIFKN